MMTSAPSRATSRRAGPRARPARAPALLALLAVAALLALLGPSASAQTPTPTPTPRPATARAPNIVVVVTDDLDTVVTGPRYRDVLPRTMARIADQGIRFRSSFCATPLCGPSRAQLLTGRYGHETKVLGNGDLDAFKAHEPAALAARLERAGYRTFIGGKYLNSFTPRDGAPHGWTDGALIASPDMQEYRGYDYDMLHWRAGRATGASTGRSWVATERVERRGRADADYSTDVVLEETLAFLRDAKAADDARPFLAYVCPTSPHFPLPPARRHAAQARRFGYRTLPTGRPNYFDDAGPLGGARRATPADKPEWLQRTWDKRSRLAGYGGHILEWFGADHPPDAPSGMLGWNQVDWYNRMGSLLACDELVDGIAEWLERSGEWDDTVFVFTSDNGYNLGAHALALKTAPYEESIRVPLFIRGGASLGFASNADVGGWAMNIDLAPTLLELAGAAADPLADGRSLVPYLRGGTPPGGDRTEALFEYHGPGQADGHLESLPGLHFYFMPAFFLDMPSYQAVRSIKTVPVNGARVARTYLFVRWDRARVGRNRLELYDLDADPYQLDNLLYHRPAQHAALARELEDDLDRLLR